MDNKQLSDTVAASWEVLLYPDEKLTSVAGTFTVYFINIVLHLDKYRDVS